MSLDTIILLAMGPTWYQCPKKCPENCEIWAINIMYRDHKDITKLFMMHDIRLEIIMHDMSFVDQVNAAEFPVYTPIEYGILKNNIVFPIEEVMKEFKLGFFLNSMAYMLAYAIMQKPKRIALYGLDMRRDSGRQYHQNEKGCIEFWVGMGMGRGIQFLIPEESGILRRELAGNWYGFRRRLADKGLFHLIPEKVRHEYTRYSLIPIDELSNEISGGTVKTRAEQIEGYTMFHEDGFLNAG